MPLICMGFSIKNLRSNKLLRDSRPRSWLPGPYAQNRTRKKLLAGFEPANISIYCLKLRLLASFKLTFAELEGLETRNLQPLETSLDMGDLRNGTFKVLQIVLQSRSIVTFNLRNKDAA